MKPARPAIPLLSWGAWLGVLTAVQVIFSPRAIQVTLLGCASAGALLAGSMLDLLERRHHAASGELSADSSFATAATACGLAAVLVGASFGLWLILIGCGVTALGLGGLVRETRARRRSLHDRRAASPRGGPGGEA